MSVDAGSLLPPPPLRERRWVPAIALAILIVGVVAGGHVASDGFGARPAGVVAVGGSVQMALAGWEIAERFDDPIGIRLTSGGASLDVTALPFDGTDIDLLREYVGHVLAPQVEQLRLSEEIERVRLANGLTGSRIAYVGAFGDVQTPVEGEITTVVSALGTGVAFDGWAPRGQLQLAVDDLHAMIETADIA